MSEIKNLISGMIGRAELFYYRNYSRKILNTSSVVCDAESELEIHSLVCRKDLINFLWCVKTFVYFSEMMPTVVVHEDGSLHEKDVRLLKKQLHGCEIIKKSKADEEIKTCLREYDNCFDYRFNKRNFHRSLKLFDFYFYSSKDRILVLDSDLLFFSKPVEIIDFFADGGEDALWMQDYVESYVMPASNLSRLLNIRVLGKVNSGLLAVSKDIFDLDVVELFIQKCRERCFVEPDFTEQTAYAILISRKNNRAFGRDRYQISDRKITDDTVCHHFVNDELGSRKKLYTEGIRFLGQKNFISDFEHRYAGDFRGGH